PAPRHLHSFPTRRSSDLFEVSHRGMHLSTQRGELASHRPARGGCRVHALNFGEAFAAIHRRPLGRPPDAARRSAVASDVVSGFKDRKSTRLNSSHVAISY